MYTKCLELISFNQHDEEGKDQSNDNLSIVREEPQRFYEGHEIEQIHK